MNCVVGDMAVILPGALPENVGAFVTVVRAVPAHPAVGPVWWVRGRQDMRTESGELHREGYIFDRLLQPIRPPKPRQQTKTATPITEVIPA